MLSRLCLAGMLPLTSTVKVMQFKLLGSYFGSFLFIREGFKNLLVLHWQPFRVTSDMGRVKKCYFFTFIMFCSTEALDSFQCEISVGKFLQYACSFAAAILVYIRKATVKSCSQQFLILSGSPTQSLWLNTSGFERSFVLHLVQDLSACRLSSCSSSNGSEVTMVMERGTCQQQLC